MTTLAANSPREFELPEAYIDDQPVIASDIIYEGAAVGDNGSGYMRPLVAGDPFRGFALLKVDNSQGSAGDRKVKLQKKGAVVLSISSLAITDVGKPVYASDDNTFTLTKGSNSAIGRVVRWISTGKGLVAFDVHRGGVGLVGEMTDNTNGTADGTVADVSTAVTGVDGTGNNAASKTDVDSRLTTIDANFADLADKVNLLARLVG